MNLLKDISINCLKLSSQSKNKQEVLKEIASLAKNSQYLSSISEDTIYAALENRENLCSTGFENQIAIPHCSFDEIKEFTIGMLIHSKGIDFQSIDKKKTKVFFFIIGPTNQRNKHIQILSSISRLAKSKSIVEQLTHSQNSDGLIKIIQQNSEAESEIVKSPESVIFHVFVQKEKYFEDILQTFSEVTDGSLTVLETMNAGHFLHTLPIFSTFWTEETKSYNRIIIAVVNKKLANNVIRRINTIVDDIEKQSGVLITANDLYYTNGAIDF
ncbi:MAG: PTS sugar transporter subunit IIA [Spirochaetes bacterium]|nr:PTS sugar transporter subunit IIA [Spirochaetota bacterium]